MDTSDVADDLAQESDAVVSADTTTDDTVKEKESQNKSAVRQLTAADLDKYTLYDVVLPLPGYSVVLPDNEVCCFHCYIEQSCLCQLQSQTVLITLNSKPCHIINES